MPAPSVVKADFKSVSPRASSDAAIAQLSFHSKMLSARFCARFHVGQSPVHMALPLPLGGHRCSEKVIYVELDLLLRDRARLQRVVRWRGDVPAVCVCGRRSQGWIVHANQGTRTRTRTPRGRRRWAGASTPPASSHSAVLPVPFARRPQLTPRAPADENICDGRSALNDKRLAARIARVTLISTSGLNLPRVEHSGVRHYVRHGRE